MRPAGVSERMPIEVYDPAKHGEWPMSAMLLSLACQQQGIGITTGRKKIAKGLARALVRGNRIYVLDPTELQNKAARGSGVKASYPWAKQKPKAKTRRRKDPAAARYEDD